MTFELKDDKHMSNCACGDPHELEITDELVTLSKSQLRRIAIQKGEDPFAIEKKET